MEANAGDDLHSIVIPVIDQLLKIKVTSYFHRLHHFALTSHVTFLQNGCIIAQIRLPMQPLQRSLADRRVHDATPRASSQLAKLGVLREHCRAFAVEDPLELLHPITPIIHFAHTSNLTFPVPQFANCEPPISSVRSTRACTRPPHPSPPAAATSPAGARPQPPLHASRHTPRARPSCGSRQ